MVETYQRRSALAHLGLVARAASSKKDGAGIVMSEVAAPDHRQHPRHRLRPGLLVGGAECDRRCAAERGQHRLDRRRAADPLARPQRMVADGAGRRSGCAGRSLARRLRRPARDRLRRLRIPRHHRAQGPEGARGPDARRQPRPASARIPRRPMRPDRRLARQCAAASDQRCADLRSVCAEELLGLPLALAGTGRVRISTWRSRRNLTLPSRPGCAALGGELDA